MWDTNSSREALNTETNEPKPVAQNNNIGRLIPLRYRHIVQNLDLHGLSIGASNSIEVEGIKQPEPPTPNAQLPQWFPPRKQ
ncbi:MAG: hypothetical protein J4432_03885 [DPANN group archaeon]|nr:hypothetical protein [DPANN group archaeon]